MSIHLLGTYCPMLKKFFAKRVDLAGNDDQHLKPNFAFSTECDFANIESTFYKGVSLRLSFSTNLEIMSFVYWIRLVHKLKIQILFWC